MNTPYLLKTDIITPEEQEIILNELDTLELLPASETSSAESAKTGEYLKKNGGAWLKNLEDYSTFKILAPILGKYFDEFADGHVLSGMIRQSNKHQWLVSYYDDGDYYKSHIDSSAGSVVFWFYREPKRFTGGEFVFDDEDINLGSLNNAVCYFSGMVIQHHVTEVSMEEQYRNQRLGRYSINVFFT